MCRLVIFGSGGFGRELVSIARHVVATDPAYGSLTFAADAPSEPIMGIKVIDPSQFLPDDRVVIATGDPAVRRRLSRRIPAAADLFSPTARIGGEVEIGEGAVFCDYTIVTASARIGRHFQCNIYSYVAHDCVIGDFVTFAPKVCCNGNVRIGDGAYIGTGAILRQGSPDNPLLIGEGAIVGMGAVVTKDVPPGATVVGNPARPLSRTE